MAELEKIAPRLGVTAEDFVRYSIEGLLSRLDQDFDQAVKYVLKKNADLYRRLAQ